MTLFEWLTEFVGIETPSLMEIIFVSCAVLGGILFFIMMILMMVGDVLGGVTDAIGLDIDAGGGAFEILSVQGLSVSVMMFGLTGMFGLSATGSDVVAVLAGGIGAVAGMYGMGKMMHAINQLMNVVNERFHKTCVPAGRPCAVTPGITSTDSGFPSEP